MTALQQVNASRQTREACPHTSEQEAQAEQKSQQKHKGTQMSHMLKNTQSQRQTWNPPKRRPRKKRQTKRPQEKIIEPPANIWETGASNVARTEQRHPQDSRCDSVKLCHKLQLDTHNRPHPVNTIPVATILHHGMENEQLSTPTPN